MTFSWTDGTMHGRLFPPPNQPGRREDQSRVSASMLMMHVNLTQFIDVGSPPDTVGRGLCLRDDAGSAIDGQQEGKKGLLAPFTR